MNVRMRRPDDADSCDLPDMPPSREQTRWSRGKWIAALLAVIINVGFVAFLFFSATWQNHNPEAVSVELYAPPGPSAHSGKAGALARTSEAAGGTSPTAT